MHVWKYTVTNNNSNNNDDDNNNNNNQSNNKNDACNWRMREVVEVDDDVITQMRINIHVKYGEIYGYVLIKYMYEKYGE